VGRKKSHKRGLRVEAEGIVVQVDGGEVGVVQDSGEDVRNACRDLVQQPAGEEVGEVCGLDMLVNQDTGVLEE
jgi:hypothetical protein